MLSKPVMQPEFHRGSCICPSYELRITERCLADDLQLKVDTPFDEAMRHPIVKAFFTKRPQIPVTGKTVASSRGQLYRLGVGDDHRGAIWHDTVNGVVWLCAYGLHRSGEPNDAFQEFKRLLADGRMYPAEADHRRLVFDRRHRFIETAQYHAMALRKAALSHPGITQEGVLGQLVKARVVAHVSSGIADLAVAFSTAGLRQHEITFVKGCFAPAEEDTLSEDTDTFGGMPLSSDEFACHVIIPA